MVGAIIVHVRRRELVNVIGTVAWFSLALFVAWSVSDLTPSVVDQSGASGTVING
jgi:hypothetical protein